MALGIKEKDGIIIESSKGFYYYDFQHKNGLKKVLRPRDNANVKKIKIDSMVEIANSKISVKIYPDGNIEIEPSL